MPLQESNSQAPVFFWQGVVRRRLEFTLSAGARTPVGHGQQPGIGAGELMRFFAEAAWYPTLLLPSPGVRWEAVNNSSAHGTLVDGPLSLKLLFSFNAEGLLDTVRADARERVVDGRAATTPWQGRFWDYAERSGMRVPLDGEVAWMLPEGEKPYWRGTTTSLNYEFVK